MRSSTVTARPAPRRLRDLCRRVAEHGPGPETPVAPGLLASWLRSRDFGLVPDGRPAGAPHASAAQLARALEQRRELVAHARPVMDFLREQTQDDDGLVILADAQGMLLDAVGDLRFADRAARVALRPGANWHEQWRGTNAIGTAIAEAAPVVVHGAEHYLERNAFLTCAAAPIADPSGRPLGVLDLSGDHRGPHRHTLALVRAAARMVEHRLFEARRPGVLRLRLHARPEGLGTVTEGRLALCEDGWIVAADAPALALLGLGRAEIGALPLERALDIDLATLWQAARQGLPRRVQRRDGAALWIRVEGGSGFGPVAGTRPAPAAAHDALAALDSGDAALQAAIGRARRVLDKPIALLLQGESGVGKEVFARAVHASGPRAGKPFVAVNCAALPEHLIEAELFGYRPGAFTGASRDGAPGRIREAHGGTLFLDEIGDMPLALQARLLRVLQERQVVPLGGGRPVEVDFALIGATHRRLADEIEAGRFREDLYYRLNGLTLKLPALRERSDLPALIARMLAEFAPRPGIEFAPELLHALTRHRWRGNLRELANTLRTACALLGPDESCIDWAHLPDDVAEALRPAPALPTPAVDDAPPTLREQSVRAIERALGDAQGNLSDAARRLGISRNTLYRRMRAARRAAA